MMSSIAMTTRMIDDATAAAAGADEGAMLLLKMLSLVLAMTKRSG